MAKTRAEKIESIENEMRQLENKRKQLLQAQKEQERKDRTRRLCKRMGLFESMLPDTITLTDEQFQTFLEKTVANDYGRRTLAAITAQTAAAAVPQATGTAARDNPTLTAKTAETARESGADEGEDE